MDHPPIIDSSAEVPEATSNSISAADTLVLAAIDGTGTSDSISAADTLVSAAIHGTVILNFLKGLAPGRTARCQAFTYNRTIKVLKYHNLLEENFTTVSYGVMKQAQKNTLDGVIGSLTPEVHGKEIFDKLKDVLLLSKSLSEGVTSEGNATTPYTRCAAGDSSVMKLSAGKRKAAKVSHTEKTIGSIVKTVGDAIRTSQSTIDPVQALRNAAYVQKPSEETVSLNLKRIRDIIEAPSFTYFSADTQTRIRNKYEAEVVRVLFD